MDIYEELKKDHDEVKKMFKQVENNPNMSARKKKFLEIKKELGSHIKLEEKHLYSDMKEKKALKDMALEGHEEHELVKKLMRDLSKDQDKDIWKAKFKVMEELVAHHVEEEEKEMFIKDKRVFGAKMSTALGERYHKEHEKMMS